MMTLRRFVPAGAALAAVLLSGVAWAETPEEQAARTLFKEGLALYEAHDYAGAIQKYRDAYARWKNPKILANLGTAAWEAGRFVESCEAYDRFLDEAPPNDPNRAEVEKARKEVLAKVGTLDIRVVGGPVALIIDGKSVDAPRLDRIRIDPGMRTVEGVGAGGLRGRQTVNVAAGATAVVELALAASSAPAQPAPTTPSATRRTPVKIDLSTKTPLPWIAAGIGGVGFVSSAVFYFGFRGSAVSDLEASCIGNACPASQQSTIDRANTFGLISAISLAVGIAGVGTGVVLFVMDKKSGSEQPPPAATVSLSATPSSMGAVARVPF
jgi:hypothetical protein